MYTHKESSPPRTYILDEGHIRLYEHLDLRTLKAKTNIFIMIITADFVTRG